MKIYTGRGDEGTTDLRDMSRVSKASPRIEAYGTVDELNAIVGTVRPSAFEDVEDALAAIQNHLHVVQADFANPDPDPEDPRVRPEHAEELEAVIDDFQAELEQLESFILPGGSDEGAKLHQARAVCRRAERRAVAFAADAGEEVNEEGEEAGSADGAGGANETALVYLNRLSDCLFVAARLVNQRTGVEEEHPTY